VGSLRHIGANRGLVNYSRVLYVANQNSWELADYSRVTCGDSLRHAGTRTGSWISRKGKLRHTRAREEGRGS
jgi:hypothetical protein